MIEVKKKIALSESDLKAIEQLVGWNQPQQAQQHHDGQCHHVDPHNLKYKQGNGDGQYRKYHHHVACQGEACFHPAILH